MCDACRSMFGSMSPNGPSIRDLSLAFGPPSPSPSPKLSEKEMIESIEAHLRRGNGLDDLTKLLTESKAKRDAEATEKAAAQAKRDEAEKQRQVKLATDKAKLSTLFATVAQAVVPHVASRRFVLAYAEVGCTEVTTVEGIEYSNGAVYIEDEGDLNSDWSDSLESFVRDAIPENYAYHIEYLD